MKITKEENKETTASLAVDSRPEYPYGLVIELEEDGLQKLGIDTMPEVGKTVMVMARADVQSVSENKTKEGERRRLSLQITDLAIEPEKEDEGAEKKLYGGGDK